MGTVDLKTPLELKTIALHARNAEYNPKVSSSRLQESARLCSKPGLGTVWLTVSTHSPAVLGGDHAIARPEDDCADLRLWKGAYLQLI